MQKIIMSSDKKDSCLNFILYDDSLTTLIEVTFEFFFFNKKINTFQ